MEQNIQWYPGHMTKTRRQMQESLKLVDAVVEILDARIPISSRNPEIDKLTAGMPRIILLNKADYADFEATKLWCGYFEKRGFHAIACDCRSGKGLNAFVPTVRAALEEKLKKWEASGMKGRYIRLLVCGIPNVGKSSFINRMAGASKAKVADRPGVTRGSQWFTIANRIELLDTPGVLWPKFDDRIVGIRLAFTGAVKDSILDTESLCEELVTELVKREKTVFFERYKLADTAEPSASRLIEAVARKRGMLVSGGKPDIERAAITILDEYRAGKLGRISFELPDDPNIS